MVARKYKKFFIGGKVIRYKKKMQFTYSYLRANVDGLQQMIRNILPHTNLAQMYDVRLEHVNIIMPNPRENYVAIAEIWITHSLQAVNMLRLSFFIYNNGVVQMERRYGVFEWPIHSIIMDWVYDIERQSKARIQARARSLKEEIVAGAWHPKRIARMIEKGGIEVMEAM